MNPVVKGTRPVLRRWLGQAAVCVLIAGGCSPPVQVQFDAHLVHDHGDVHVMPTKQHSATITPGRGEIRVTGKMPLGGRCPELKGEIERDRQLLSLDVDVEPGAVPAGQACSAHLPVMGEYTAVITGLRSGEYTIMVHHHSESEPDAEQRVRNHRELVVRKQVHVR